jgi:hypothetical protein
MHLRSVAKLFLAALMVAAVAQLAVAEDVVHAVEGVVSKVDLTGKTIVVKTADGTEHAFKYTEKTTVRGVKDTGHVAKVGAVDTYMKGKEGTTVLVHYTGEGAEKSAVGFRDLGKDTVKVSEGTVTKIDKAARTVTVKTEDGSEATYHVAKDATVDTGHGLMKGADYAKEGEKVTVHYTEDAGKKVAHFIHGL